MDMVNYYLQKTKKTKKELRQFLLAWGYHERTIRIWLKSGPPFERIPQYGKFFSVPWQQLICGRSFNLELSPQEADLLHLYRQLSDEEQAAVLDVTQLMAKKLENLSLM